MDDIEKQDASDESLEFTGEDNVDELDIEDAEESLNTKISKLRKDLATCATEKAAALEDLQRTRADFLNSKKRLEEQTKLDRERILDTFLTSLLPLSDSFAMAFADTAAWEAVDENWRKGVEAIQSQLAAILRQHNVEEIGAVGEHFDPTRHEALSAIDDGGESETVVDVMQKGYARNGVVIRPAKVIIRN